MNPNTERLTHANTRRSRRRFNATVGLAVLTLVVGAGIGCAMVVSNFVNEEPSGSHLNFFNDRTQTSQAGYVADDGYIPAEDPIHYTADAQALTKLDPSLLDALIAAGQAAEGEGVSVKVTSGWRSAELQRSLLAEAIDDYGVSEAQRLVKSPNDSEHVKGRAVDIAPSEAAAWMSRFGADFGLCQTYANEPWHFELTALDGICPPMKADATS